MIGNRVFKCKVQFGKLNLYGTGRRYPAEIEIQLRQCGGDEVYKMIDGQKIPTGEKTPAYIEFSACGTVWNSVKSDCIMGGQCIDHMSEYIKTPVFRRILKWWKQYHLNGMNAGTPEQTAAIEEWKNAGNRYDYTAACEELKRRGLYEVPFYGQTTGRQYTGELYRYGNGWIINHITAADLEAIADFISSQNGQPVPEWLKTEEHARDSVLDAAAHIIESIADNLTPAATTGLATA